MRRQHKRSATGLSIDNIHRCHTHSIFRELAVALGIANANVSGSTTQVYPDSLMQLVRFITVDARMPVTVSQLHRRIGVIKMIEQVFDEFVRDPTKKSVCGRSDFDGMGLCNENASCLFFHDFAALLPRHEIRGPPHCARTGCHLRYVC